MCKGRSVRYPALSTPSLNHKWSMQSTSWISIHGNEQPITGFVQWIKGTADRKIGKVKRHGSWSEAKHHQSNMAACMTVDETGSLVFIDDVTADKSSRINSDVYRDILSDQIQPNAAKLVGQPSQCRWSMNQNTLQKQLKNLSGQRNEIFFSGQFSYMMSTQLKMLFIQLHWRQKDPHTSSNWRRLQ